MAKRERFLSKMMENIRLPYEAKWEGPAAGGEFRNQVEEEYLHQIVDKTETNAVILDLACGDGRHTLRLAERVAEVVGLDLTRNSLVKAKKKCLVIDNVIFTHGSIFQLPFRPNTFDGIWFSEAFEYVPPDKRRTLLTSLNNVLKGTGILYMSVETWQNPSIITSLKRLWTDCKLFCYWKFIRRKPLLWGEFLYYSSVKRIDWSGWHYHVHTSKKTLCNLLEECGFTIEKMELSDECIYVLCRKASG
ncbi:MAG: methyltransferase domain-containing protein [Dehalococcoidales bacterium]|nr:MAG: methyltransferase domain-containing protein [Dehalococcoidales bacterium]